MTSLADARAILSSGLEGSDRALADNPSATSVLLAAGGDMRIWPDPVTGRNKYGTLTTPAPDEISFSSTTASNVSTSAFAAAERGLARLMGSEGCRSVAPEQWFDAIRSDIVKHLGLPGVRAVLAASGTDAEILALGLCTSLTPRPLTNIFIAPDETGLGVPLAAGGKHFSSMTALGAAVAPGQAIEGFSPERIEVQAIALRDDAGRPRSAEVIDDDAIVMVERALRRDRDVLIHVLDSSKTGLGGLTRNTARALAARAPGRVRVVVDACQLRNPLADLRGDLANGFLVTVTGSKFAAGPPFAGVLLIPSDLVDEIASDGFLPAGLTDYSAALDWPERLRDTLGVSFKSQSNVGLGLRWIAALDHIAAYARVPNDLRTIIFDRFVREVRVRAALVKGIVLHPYDDFGVAGTASIVPLTVLRADGKFASLDEAQGVQAELRSDQSDRICHVGQAVRVGPRAALRVAISALDVASIACRIDDGETFNQAFAPISSDLDVLFGKWRSLDRRA